MFDIEWGDEDTENIGERRKRKEREREERKATDPSFARLSLSTESSYSSGEKSNRFFGSLGLKKGKKTLQQVRTKDGSPRKLVPASSVPDSSTAAVHDISVVSEDISSKNLTDSNNPPPSQGGGAWDVSTDRSSKESMSSKLTAMTTPPLASPSVDFATDLKGATTRFIQSFGTNGFVSQTTETKVEPMQGEELDAPAHPTILAHVPAIPAQPKLAPTPPPSPLTPSLPTTPLNPEARPLVLEPLPLERALQASSSTHTGSSSTPDLSSTVLPGGREKLTLRTAIVAPSSTLPSPHLVTPTRPSHGKKLAVIPPVWPTPYQAVNPNHHRVNNLMQFQDDNPDAWKPPDVWGSTCSPTVPRPVPENSASGTKAENVVADSPTALDPPNLQRKITGMAAASSYVTLTHLNEKWGSVSDAALYKQLEHEKKLWMLTALRKMNDAAKTKEEKSKDANKQKDQQILALFESTASASFLAATHPKAEITHLGPSPLPRVLFPNVKPYLTKIRSLAALPLVKQSFTDVYCLNLPTLMPSQDIPIALRSIYNALVPQGTLHLTLIDPSPATQTVGPLMRQWLEDHLLLNLEADFRCVRPCRLFPAWLAGAQLRGNNSTISRMRFTAVPSKPAKGENSPATTGQTEKQLERELRSVIGRMLWQEVWGGFVHGAAWWWQDPEIVQECLDFGTYFEYYHIEAVKHESDR